MQVWGIQSGIVHAPTVSWDGSKDVNCNKNMLYMVLWNYIHNAYQGRGKQRTNYMSLAVGGGAWGILPKGSDLIGVSKDA